MTDFSDLIDALNKQCVEVFGEEEKFALVQGNNETNVGGIFDSRYYTVDDIGAEIGVSTLITTLTVDLDETGAVTTSDKIERLKTGEVYRIKDIRPDGQGMAVLELEHDD